MGMLNLFHNPDNREGALQALGKLDALTKLQERDIIRRIESQKAQTGEMIMPNEKGSMKISKVLEAAKSTVIEAIQQMDGKISGPDLADYVEAKVSAAIYEAWEKECSNEFD